MEIAYDTLLYIDKESIRKADPVIILKHKGHLFYENLTPTRHIEFKIFIEKLYVTYLS